MQHPPITDKARSNEVLPDPQENAEETKPVTMVTQDGKSPDSTSRRISASSSSSNRSSTDKLSTSSSHSKTEEEENIQLDKRGSVTITVTDDNGQTSEDGQSDQNDSSPLVETSLTEEIINIPGTPSVTSTS